MGFNVKLSVVPAVGDQVTTDLTVEATVTVADVLRAGNIALITDKMMVRIDGKPVKLDTPVSEGTHVTVTEKPSGS